MSRSLDDLCPTFRKFAVELIAHATEQGIPVMIIDTLRTEEEQAVNLANGVSWTKNSKHLPQLDCDACGPLGGMSHAIDLAPYEEYRLHGSDKLNWNAMDPVWEKLCVIGETLSLRCGHRWQKRDSGHFEMRETPVGFGIAEE